MIEPPFCYTGSKQKLLTQLIPLFPPAFVPGDTHIRVNRFIDLFAGGGSVYTNVAANYEQIIANDIISDLMEAQRSLINDTAGFMLDLMRLWVDRKDAAGYKRLREDYNIDPTPAKLFMLMLCCTNNMIRFNKKFKFNQTHGKRSLNPKTIEKINDWVAYLKPYRDNIKFCSMPFEQVEVKAGDFIYADPPYEIAQAGYNAYWNKENDAKLLKYLVEADKIGAKFCLSGVEYHDGRVSQLLKQMAELGYKRTEIKSDYSKVSRKGRKQTCEVVFRNYGEEA